jgi:Spy/CpxP family protein refolding chaperone
MANQSDGAGWVIKLAKAIAWASMVWGMVAPAAEAPAQVVRSVRVGGGPIGGGGGPGGMISKRSVEDYATLLGLTDDQRETVRTLHEGYREAMKAYQAEMDAKVEEVQEKANDSGDLTVFQKDLPNLMRERIEKSQGMNKRFLEDFKATLEPAQAEQWGKVERQRRRETMLMGGFYSGGNVDLVDVVRRENLSEGLASPASTDFANAMDEYERDMDRVLADFERVRAELRKQEGGPAMIVTTDGNGVQADPRMKTLAEYSKKIRDLNDRYVARLGQVLDEQGRQRLERGYGQRAFGRVYGKSYAQDLLEAAKAMDDLGPSEREKLAELAARYDDRSRALNRQWVEAQRRLDEATDGLDFGAMRFNFGGGEENQPEDEPGRARKAVTEAATARRELDKAIEKAVRELLSNEQRDRLPEKRDRQDESWNMHGGTVEIEERAD